MIQRLLTIVFVLVCTIGGGYFAYTKLMPPQNLAAEGPLYATTEVKRGDISVDVETSGSLNPSRGGSIQAPFPSGAMRGPSSFIIEDILVEDGDPVQMGQPIIRLLAPDLESNVEELAREIENDIDDLADLLGVPNSQALSANPAQGVVLRAPIGGRIIGLKANEGTEIKQGEIVARVVDDSQWQATARLTEAEFKSLGADDDVRVQFGVFDGLVPAKIRNINPNPIPTPFSELNTCQGSASSISGQERYLFTYQVTIEGDNPGLVQPGMTLRTGFIRKAERDQDSPPVHMTAYCTEVESYVREERVISRAEGLVTQLVAKEMQMVKAGDAILTLSGDETRRLIEEKQRQIRQKQDELQNTKQQLGQLVITAPMDGVIAQIEVQKGQSVEWGHWMGSVYNTSDMRIWTQVDDIDVLRVQQGAEVDVTVDALPNEKFTGRVTDIATMGMSESGITQFQVGIQVKGGPELRPGMQAKARIKAGDATDVLLIPIEAVFEEDGQTKVEILNPDGTTNVVRVELGLMNDRVAEVKSGLEEGWLVITGSSADLLPSQRIRSQDTLLPVPPGEGDQDGGGAPDRGGSPVPGGEG